MKITALRLFNVRRFANRGVAIEGIGDGVNILSAANEFGKSTSFEALHALFFQHHASETRDVKSLRPYSGGRVLIEADVATPQGAFRIAKQFYGKGAARIVDLANGRLIAQADEAEAFIAALTRGGTAGPNGLLWVRQGMTGVEKRSKSDEDGDASRRATLLQSVHGEVEAITGGRRMADIMARVQGELDDLVTPREKAKANGRYALAIDDRDRLAIEEDRLRRDVALLRDALDKRAAAKKRQAELDDPREEERRKKAIETAQAAFDAARSLSEALRTAQVELALTQAQAGQARRASTDFSRARKRADIIAGDLDEAERRRRDAQGKREAANEAASNARAEFEAAERSEDEARKRLAQAELALRAQEARERLADLERRLEAAETLGKTIEADEAALRRTRLPEKAMAELEALHLDIARLAAVAEAARPTVTARYEPGAPIASLDGAPLKTGEPRGYDGLAELAIPGVGLLTLRSFHAAGGDEKLRKAKERQAALLATIGVDNLDAARARQAQALRLAGDARDAQSRLSLLAPDGLLRLRETALAQRAAAIDMPEISEDADHARATCEAASQRKAAARAAWTAVGPSQARATDAVIEAQTRLAALETERAQIDAFLGAPETRQEREAKLDAELTRLDAQASAQMQDVARLRQAPDDLDAAAATLRRLRSAEAAIETERAQLRETIADLSGAINARAEDSVDEDWRECVDALAAANARVAAYEKEIAVLRRLLAALEAARGQARETYLQPVMNELRPLLRLLFDDVSIAFDEKTLVPHKIVRGGQRENVADLSGGMREQLSILTRLAFARLLAKDGRPAPVILDDALVYSDDERIEKMFDALHRQAADQQIIVFSCRQRAFQSLGGTVLRMVDWTPG